MRNAASTVFLAATLLQAGANSPVNQVFQFSQSGSYSAWSDHATTKATAYLWIPEHCRRLRGLLILGSNVPEHMLAGHPAIRAVCSKNNLGIVWSSPTFWYHKATKTDNHHVVAFLQQLLDGLAATSGYPEVATVPWLPMGESGHLLMVDALVEDAPDRCMAGIWIKNAHLPPTNRSTPALIVYGTAQEWGQDKVDIREHWKNLKPYENAMKQRKTHPDWPLSFVVDGGSGHFDVSERLVQYFAHYIDSVAKVRLGGAGGLRRVQLSHGVVAGLPLPANAPASPWFFDRAAAREAQAIAQRDWQAASQLPAFENAGHVVPFDFNGISSLAPPLDADGVTFRLRPLQLDRIPDTFSAAGEALAKSSTPPVVEWLCGPVAPLGGGEFRIALDRSWPHHPIYLAARVEGAGAIRDAVQPIAIKLRPNLEGVSQRITFEPIKDVFAGAQTVDLRASSDSGLPVRFFVVSGPAVIEGSRLQFTPIPPKAKLPIEVTVSAWQWGRSIEPKVRTADLATRTFQILNRP